MNLSTPFIHRPVGTTLLTAAITLAGMIAFLFLPVSPLPQVEFPTIQVSANLPGASPETMASAVATPLERQFGRIAGVTEMTSTSGLGSTSISLQFDLNRDIDAAAREVQAAINAASGQLPANLPKNPSYRKVNPADAPIMILSVTSTTYDKAKMYDVSATILQQKLSQVEGVGQVFVGGGSTPAVRVDVNLPMMNNLGLGLEDVRQTLASANANRPKGQLSDETRSWSITASDQLSLAKDYRPLIVRYQNGSPIRIGDIAEVTDSVEDVRTSGFANTEPAVSLIIFRQPGANIIDTVDRIRALMPQLRADIPAGMKLEIILDRTTTIRASVLDVEMTLALSVGLVILVVFLFLRSGRATFIPSIAVPVSLVSTFAFMYLAGYSIDNLSLMALTIATGFVVDDAIVVIENITRHIEEGMSPYKAAIKGASEIGFTVLSISLSLVAVFIPILLMGGIVGRLFREFAVTLSFAIAVSLVISLTTTPMMCARLLRGKDEVKHGKIYLASEAVFLWILRVYERSLHAVLRHQTVTMLVTLGTVGLTVYLYIVIPKGFFPQQDTGRLTGSIVADQDTSSQAMRRLLVQYIRIISEDPAVENLNASAGGTGGGGGGSANTARMFISLKPLEERRESVDQVMARLRGKLANVPGASLFLQPVQDIRVGGRASSALYQFTMQGDDLKELNEWSVKLLQAMRALPNLVDVNSDQQNGGLQANVTVDRTLAKRLGISQSTIDDTLYDAFGQRQVSTIYTPLNQYHVVMEADPRYLSSAESLKQLYVRGNNGARVPLSAICKFSTSPTPLAVNHSGQFPSVTISFNLTPGTSLGDAVAGIEEAQRELGLPANIQGKFQGTAQAFQQSLKNQPWLIAAAILTVYIVLGMLYESYIHPLTILSTLPSAGVGALLALLICKTELSVMALIGILLLIGIVKKNAIMMIDFALEAERTEKLTPEDAIFKACILRFRPIIMTTMAALLGGLPLALGTGTGSELRRPLGIAIVGGLIFSQVLTLYTTPVVYLFLERIRLAWLGGKEIVESNAEPQTDSH